MNFFTAAPFIRILPSFIIGVVLSFYDCFSPLLISITLVTVIIVFLIWIRSSFKSQYKFRFVSPSLLVVAFLCIGFLSDSIRSEKFSTENFISGKSEFIIAEISSIPSASGKAERVEAIIKFAVDSGKLIPVRFKSYIYFRTDSMIPEVGDQIILKNKLALIEGPANPGQFDFRKYCSLKRIIYQCKLNPGEWRSLKKNSSFSVLNESKHLRDKLLSCFRKAGIKDQQYAVLSALVLGYDDEINKEIMNAFSATGTLHILSVSGMHVGIVFTALSFLFRKMENKKYWWLIRVFIIVFVIWFYAILTGLSPSVIRSAMMFTFILAGKAFNRSSNIYNTLAASILCICILFDPLLLFEPGFQLSYFAVAGIAFIYPPISRWFYVKNKVLSAIWSLIAVSIAAQLATFPISLFYFHQFPNYFIPANLLIIPLSTIIIFGGLFLFLINSFEWLLLKAGYCMNKLLELLNVMAERIKSLPFAVSEELYLSFPEMILLYLILLFMIFYFLNRSISALKYSALLFSVFLLLKITTTLINLNRREVVIYSTFSSPVAEIISGQNSFLFYSSADSIRAIKYSNDLHAYYRFSVKNRLEFKTITSLGNGIYAGRKYFKLENGLKKVIILTYKQN